LASSSRKLRKPKNFSFRIQRILEKKDKVPFSSFKAPKVLKTRKLNCQRQFKLFSKGNSKGNFKFEPKAEKF